jgi:hypothetical protein
MLLISKRECEHNAKGYENDFRTRESNESE